MNLLMRHLAREWPVWTALLFIALLPFGRLSEIPLSFFALALPFLWRVEHHRQIIRKAAHWVVPLFLCFWIPMLVSSFDSILPQKSWSQSLVALRFLAAALSIATLLHTSSSRWRVMRWSAYLLIFWAIDGFVQLLLGSDLFGIPMHPDRLNALFVGKHQFYGPTLAMLSPLLLEYARRQWSSWFWALAFTLILGAVMISGMRSAWLSMAIVLATYFVLMMRRENRELRRTFLAIPILALLITVISYNASPLFQQRVELTRAVYEGTEASIDYASSERLPIFSTALAMYRHHPINGVGVRAFPKAYTTYAAEDDIHIAKSGGHSGATHAHNLVLEVMSDTGTIGLAGLLLALFLAIRFWRQTTPVQHHDAFPFVLAIGLILFPLNSHFSVYGTYTSSLVWFLVGLWASTIRESVVAK